MYFTLVQIVHLHAHKPSINNNHYMAELVLGEKEDSDWFLSDSYFAIQTAKMDCSQTDIIDLCS